LHGSIASREQHGAVCENAPDPIELGRVGLVLLRSENPAENALDPTGLEALLLTFYFGK